MINKFNQNKRTMFAQIAQITDSLFLSSAHAVTTRKLQSKGITQVVNCTLEVAELRSNDIKTVRILIADAPQSDLGVHFLKVASVIEKEKNKGGKTLVHCVAGISRSATLCIAYLMKYHEMDLRKAYYHVKEKRPVIHPNPGFFRQLIVFEKHLYNNKSTVKMVNSPIGMVPDVYYHK